MSTYIVADAIIYFSCPFPIQVVVDFASSFLHKRDGGKQESPTSLLLALISKKHKVIKRFEIWPELGGWGGVGMILKSHPSFRASHETH